MALLQREIAALKDSFACIKNVVKLLKPLTIDTRSKDKTELKNERVEKMTKAVAELERAEKGFAHIEVLERNIGTYWLGMNTKLDEIQNSTRSQATVLSELSSKVEQTHEDSMSIKDEVKQVVKENLKTVLKEAVDQMIGGETMKKTFADALKGSQSVIKEQTRECFTKSLGEALKDSQNEIISQTTAKQEADMVEKEKRSRNCVISGVKESELTVPDDRRVADTLLAEKLMGLEGQKSIVKCFRAGPILGTGSNSSRTEPRPLIVTLVNPELAKQAHNYGNGAKINVDGTDYWVNPDLTRTERKANYLARQKKRGRIPNSENSGNVATG